jgi:hypothetical protein
MLLFVCFQLPPTIKIRPISVHASIITMTTSIPIPTIVALPQQSATPKNGSCDYGEREIMDNCGEEQNSKS